MKKTMGIVMAAGVLLAGFAVAGAAVQAPAGLDPLAQHQRLEARIGEAADLSGPQRTQMQLNLEACRALGLGPADVGLLFPGDPDGDLEPAAALRLQSAVIRAARGDLPVEPLLAKIREGRMKGVPDGSLVQAGERVVDDLYLAGDLLAAAEADGLTAAADDAARREQIRVLSRAVWRGLTPEEGARLRLRAGERLPDGPCATADLVAAAELAVRIREQGGDREDALGLAGAALARGYTAPDLAELGRMVTAGRLSGGDLDALLTDLTGRVDEGLAAGALNRYLQQSGWMGPADAPGAGGRQGGGHQGDGPGSGGSGGGSGGDGTAGGSSGDRQGGGTR